MSFALSTYLLNVSPFIFDGFKGLNLNFKLSNRGARGSAGDISYVCVDDLDVWALI